MKVYISDKLGEERFPQHGDKEVVFGKAHYSWKIISGMYRRAIENYGLETVNITAPDIYQHEIAQRCVGIGSDDIHLAVKPIEWIRPMFGRDNYFVCGWEFPQFSDQGLDGNPTTNHIAILEKSEGVLCWSQFTVDNLKSYGIEKAVALPPPVVGLFDRTRESIGQRRALIHEQGEIIPGPEQYHAIEDIRKDADVLFVSVLNPWDMRKNLHNFLTAFRDANGGGKKRITLLVKLIIDNIGTHTKDILAILATRFDLEWDCLNIYFIGEPLSLGEMADLYHLADFYISPASTEGLNLPLIEAMSCGIPAISSNVTAMADYIDKENAIVLDTRCEKAGAAFSALGGALELTHFPPTLDTMTKAIKKAATMPVAARKAMGAAARKTVSARYGHARFKRDFKNLLAKR